MIDVALTYIRGAVQELHHVRWPTRKQAIRLSGITIIFTLSSAAVYGIIDFFLGRTIAILLHFA